MGRIIICIATSLVCLFSISSSIEVAQNEETRPYEFSFSIQDFQHRFEKKDSEGIITGEFGFITGDGVYHETAYTTDINGNFVITRMRNRKITSLQDAEKIFKGKPEVAKRLIQVLAKSCSGCKIPVANEENNNNVDNKPGERVSNERKKVHPASIRHEVSSKQTAQVRSSEAINREKETAATSRLESALKMSGKVEQEEIVNKTLTVAHKLRENEISNDDAGSTEINNPNVTDDLFYRFNYTITTHGHQETGYRDGKKDGAYRTAGINGTDAQVDYLSNEFGHQPNISFVYRQEPRDDADVTLKRFTFEWIYGKH